MTEMINKMTIEQEALVTDNINFMYWKTDKWNKNQNTIDKDELVSIAMLSLVKAAKTFNPEKKTLFATYLNFIIDNDIKTELKKTNRQSSIIYKIQDDMNEDEYFEDDYSDNLSLKTAIENLPERHRNMLIDFHQAGYNQYEIAEKYNVSQTTVSIVLRKAKDLIEEHINT